MSGQLPWFSNALVGTPTSAAPGSMQTTPSQGSVNASPWMVGPAGCGTHATPVTLSSSGSPPQFTPGGVWAPPWAAPDTAPAPTVSNLASDNGAQGVAGNPAAGTAPPTLTSVQEAESFGSGYEATADTLEPTAAIDKPPGASGPVSRPSMSFMHADFGDDAGGDDNTSDMTLPQEDFTDVDTRRVGNSRRAAQAHRSGRKAPARTVDPTDVTTRTASYDAPDAKVNNTSRKSSPQRSVSPQRRQMPGGSKSNSSSGTAAHVPKPQASPILPRKPPSNFAGDRKKGANAMGNKENTHALYRSSSEPRKTHATTDVIQKQSKRSPSPAQRASRKASRSPNSGSRIASRNVSQPNSPCNAGSATRPLSPPMPPSWSLPPASDGSQSPSSPSVMPKMPFTSDCEEFMETVSNAPSTAPPGDATGTSAHERFAQWRQRYSTARALPASGGTVDIGRPASPSRKEPTVRQTSHQKFRTYCSLFPGAVPDGRPRGPRPSSTEEMFQKPQEVAGAPPRSGAAAWPPNTEADGRSIVAAYRRASREAEREVTRALAQCREPSPARQLASHSLSNLTRGTLKT